MADATKKGETTRGIVGSGLQAWRALERRGTMRTLTSVLMLLWSGRMTLGGTYYVTTNGNDTAAGTSNAPWATLQRASNNLLPGDTVIVRAGNYSGFVMGWTYAQNGSNGAPISFLADPGATITNCNYKTGDGIDLEGCSWITIDGFTFINPLGTNGISRAGVRSCSNGSSNAVHVMIRRCTAVGCGNYGIFTSHSDYLLIESNDCSGSILQHGIYVSNACVGPALRGNRSHDNCGCGLHFNGDKSQGGSGLISNALIEGNVIYNNGLGGPGVATNGGSGINGDGVQDSTIRNNLLFRNHGSGIALFKTDAAQGAQRDVVVNNTIVQASDGKQCLNINTGSTSNTVFNNILYNENSSSLRGSIQIDASSLSGFRSDNNIGCNKFSLNSGSSFVTLAQWQSATSQDAHSTNSTPAALFVSEAASNYLLRAGSPAIDAGVVSLNGCTAPAVDLNGRTRPMGGGVDIGAYEYLMYWIAAPASVNGTVSPAGTVWVAAGSNQTFSISPNPYYSGQDVVVDGQSAGATTQYTFVAVVSNHTLQATFTALLATNAVPQWWLAQYGWTNNFDTWALADTDGDGLAAWQEYVAGTDPTNRASTLVVTSIDRSVPPSVVIRWASVSNRFYAVNRSANLANGAGWTVASSNLAGCPPMNVYTDSISGTGPYFYKVTVQP